ncbi:hypothetical protein JCM11641_003486 [Rhodosporidiobolus odoratus]
MDPDLKQELKQWEASFQSKHGRAPTKEDIKLHPDVAAKYKQYNKAKVLAGKAPPQPDKKSSKPSTSSSSASKALPPPQPVFKTPTKPKPSRPRPKPTAVEDPSTSSDTLPAHPSPSKRSTSASRSSGNAEKPTYVLANSPSKLRALAALHSTSGSPNRRTDGGWNGATLAPGLESVKQVDPLEVSRSPQKAKNPFASPRKEKGVFGEFEKQEREKMKEKKRAEREKRKTGGGVLGKGATGRGAGWGSASMGETGKGAFSRTSSVASNGMDLDEVDDFFSSQPSQNSQTSHFASQLAKASPQRDVIDDDDEVLGPSPAKPSTAFSSIFGLPDRSPSSSSTSSSKPFEPLLGDSNPFTAPASSAPLPSKPKLFETSLRASVPPASSTSAAPPKLPSFSSSAAAAARGLKRAPSTTFSGGGKGGGGGKKPAPGAEGDEEDEYDDGDDSFYADALDAADAAAVGTKGKGKKAPAKRKRTVVKGKGKAMEDAEDIDDGVTVLRENGELVLEVEGEEGEDGETKRERLVVHSKGWQARQKDLEREDRRRSRREEGGMEEDGEEDNGPEEDSEEDMLDDISLLQPRGPVDLLTSLANRSAPPPSIDAEDDDDPSLAASLPADLAAVLSFRTGSPQKASRAKEQLVARLLGEPGARGRKKGGLLDLQDDEGGEEGEEVEEGEEGGDDDWDEEPDGWKEAGEAMDGYYSGGEDW